MDGRGECCLVRYAGRGTDVASKVERIMLRYRPIAPKPASPGGSPPSASLAVEELRVGRATTRRRRRREGVGRQLGRKRRSAPCVEAGVAKTMVVAPHGGNLVTLQLMPGTPVAATAGTSPPPPDLLQYYSPPSPWCGPHAAGELPSGSAAPAESWVTLECVTETCDASAVGEGRCSWAEARAALEGDACPAFLSDVFDRVVWTNAAYRRMVGAPGEAVVTSLVTGGRVPACGDFSCRVRVRCSRRCGQIKFSSLVVPCDVLRLAPEDCSWLAWRLDVTAALSLGR